MAIFVNKASVNAGKVQLTVTAPAANQALNALQGARYGNNDQLYVTTAAPLSTATWTQGVRFDTNGAMHVWPLEANGAPPGIDSTGNLTLLGQVIITNTSVTRYFNGWPIAANGYICAVIV